MLCYQTTAWSTQHSSCLFSIHLVLLLTWVCWWSACALITVRVLLIWHPFRQHFSTKLNAYLLPVTNTPCSAEVRCVSFKNKPIWRSVWLFRINCVALGCFTFLHCLCRLTLEVVSCNTNIPQASYVASKSKGQGNAWIAPLPTCSSQRIALEKCLMAF